MIQLDTKYLLFLFFAFILNACSPEAGKKTLNFFFDGVPTEENLEQKVSIDSIIRKDTSGFIITSQTTYHIPYLEKKCAACHDQNIMGRYVMPEPRLCYQCHDNFEETYRVLHGPVGGGYCSACHHPHFSKQEKLLTRYGQDLCLHCHVPGEGFNTKIHEGIEDTNCIECHNPHGGEDRLMFN